MPSLPVAWFNLNRKGRKKELREGGREGREEKGRKGKGERKEGKKRGRKKEETKKEM